MFILGLSWFDGSIPVSGPAHSSRGAWDGSVAIGRAGAQEQSGPAPRFIP